MPNFAGVVPTSSAAGASGADAELLARLKAWRLAQAQEQSVPAFVIFHDSTLAAITVRSHPCNVIVYSISARGSS